MSEKTVGCGASTRRRFCRASLAALAAGAASAAAEGQSVHPKAFPPLDVSAANRALAEHRIVRIEGRRMQDRYPRSVAANAKGKPVGGGGSFDIRILTTSQGAVGWGMAHGDDAFFAPYVGRSVADLFDAGAGMAEGVERLDIALHDLVGVILGRPVWSLLGAAGPLAVPVYSGAIYIEDLFPVGKPRGVAAVVAACRQDHEAGYRAFKLKVGRGLKLMDRAEGLRRDIEVTRAVRQAFPDCRVLVDANDGWTLDDAIAFARETADCDLFWIEEPFEEDGANYRRLRDALAQAGARALIADGESRRDQAPRPTRFGGYTGDFAEKLLALAREKLVDVILWDLGILGYTRWRAAMREIAAAGAQASPHTWMWTPRPFYAAQLAAGLGHVPIVEGIPGRAKGIDYSAWRIDSGNLIAPQIPGMGLSLENPA